MASALPELVTVSGEAEVGLGTTAPQDRTPQGDPEAKGRMPMGREGPALLTRQLPSDSQWRRRSH